MHTFTGFSPEIEVVIERREHAPAGGVDRSRPDRPMPRRSCSMSELVLEDVQSDRPGPPARNDRR